MSGSGVKGHLDVDVLSPNKESDKKAQKSKESPEKNKASSNQESETSSLAHSNVTPLEIHDEAENVEDLGGRFKDYGPRQDSKTELLHSVPRLLLVSSKIKNGSIMQGALCPNVTFVQYKYETSTLDGILACVAQSLGSKKVESIALVLHGSNGTINLCGKEEKVITKENILEVQSLREFFSTLIANHLDQTWVNARLDFLASNAAQTVDGGLIAREIETIVGVPVGISKDFSGSDIPMERLGEENTKNIGVGELYFRMDKLRNWNGGNQQTLAGFEKIRTVGKGAYGTAVLYRKKDDDSLVILKEINLHDLNAPERQLALNEVKVLAMLDHPNIISYYDSFEEDGIVMIEMEYADGGTLAQYLNQQDKPLEEREILAMFQQMVAAIRHIHEHNILHRDLKTANIFLTKEGIVKVGDFGISKLMSTSNKGANTVLGTPYYISPEMCEGKPYNDKSDIWALGCILYEMACLQRTFEGSNLPALVNKIMKGQFAPVKGSYSQEFKHLIRDMLQREPEYRPSATELWCFRLPELMSKYEDPLTDYEDELLMSSENQNFAKKRTRSVLYYLEMSSMSLNPVVLPSKVKIRNIAVGGDHVICVTVERMVFTWGEGSRGQLGHGNLEARQKPELVEALKGKSITKACCGDGFSVFASDNGILMTCGDGNNGALGHGDWCSTSRPRLIEALLSVDVISMACGLHHVVAVGSDGEVFSWGKGAGGRLGLGNEEDQCQPAEVKFTDTLYVREVQCGNDGTMLITDVGSVLACGNNEYNKLGLNQRQGFLMAMKNIFNKMEVEGQLFFSVVKALARHRVIDVSMGPTHSAVLVEPGHVYTFGRNTEGQLGTNNNKPQNAPIEVKLFEERPALKVRAGEYYTVACTVENELLFWGTRFKNRIQLDESLTPSNQRRVGIMRVESAGSNHSRHASSASMSSVSSVRESENNNARENQATKETPERAFSERQFSSDSIFSASGDRMNNSVGSGGFRPLSSTPRRTASASSSKEKDKEKDGSWRDDTELILTPTPLLRMDSAGTHSTTGETVTLSNFFCHGENLFMQVETTAPPPKRKSRRKRHMRRRIGVNMLEVPEGQMRMSASSHDGGDEYSSEASELDTFGTIPAWIKQELANSESYANDGHEPDDTSEPSDEESGMVPDASMSSIRINKDLKQGAKVRKSHQGAAGSKGAEDEHSDKVGSKDGKKANTKLSSAESGVDFPSVDPMSSTSSSSEAIASGLVCTRDNLTPRSLSEPKKPTPRKVTVPMPYKSKSLPTQKPLNRLRAQSKQGRVKGDAASPKTSVELKNEEMTLQLELEKMKEEKQRMEDRLQKMEEQYHRQQEQIQLESEKKALERELELKSEIHNLRQEVMLQNNKLKDNYSVVTSLQKELSKVQTEQSMIREREQQRSSDNVPRQSVRESRVCVVQ